LCFTDTSVDEPALPGVWLLAAAKRDMAWLVRVEHKGLGAAGLGRPHGSGAPGLAAGMPAD
jgi:hypothetical protein